MAQTKTYASGSSKRKKAADQKRNDEVERKKMKSMDHFVTKSKSVEQEVKSLVSDLVERVEKILLSASKTVTVSNSPADADESQTIQFSSDPALWPPSNEKLRTFWIMKGWPDQNISLRKNFPETKKTDGRQSRFLTLSAFHPQIQNSETVPRHWLVYSPSQQSIFCAACKLFSSGQQKNSLLSSKEGYSDWKNVTKMLAEHEMGDSHLQSMILFNNLRKKRGVDVSHRNQLLNRLEYWRKVLHRVVEVVRFLSVRALALRGDNEIIGSTQNGNFLGVMELIAKFDSFTEEHLKKYGNPGQGRVSYLSSTIVEEFIQLMADKVMGSIIQEVKEAKYFAISVDSTPDVSHIDQLTFIVRYFSKDGTAVERFLAFLPISDHHGEGLATEVLGFLKEKGINIGDCRGQCYDNAPNMSGRYKGLQARIQNINHLAKFSPCTAHSLNLIGETAVKACTGATKYFRHVQKIYNFFAGSPNRWKVLSDSLSQSKKQSKVVKSLSETRWSARADAISALTEQLDLIQAALLVIAGNSDLDSEVCSEAESLLLHSLKPDFCLLCCIWNRILQRFDAVSVSLQQSDLDLSAAVILLQSLSNFTVEIENDFPKLQLDAELLLKNGMKVLEEKCVKFSSQRESRFNSSFNEKSFIDLLSTLQIELQKRLNAYSEVRETFGVITRFPRLENKDIIAQCSNLVAEYSTDLKSELADELISLKKIVPANLKSASNIFSWLKEIEVFSSFPNVYVAFRIFLTMMPTNCTGERSFSKLKLVKNERRSTMGQTRLSALSLLSIESVLTNSIDFNEVINDFAAQKCRKKST